MSSFQNRFACMLVCVLASSSALAERRIPIVSEGAADKDWLPAAAWVAPGYPPGADRRVGDVCVNIGYLLGEDGTPSEFAHLKSWSDPRTGAAKDKHRLDVFERAAVATLLGRRFVSKHPASPTSVYTSATFVFPADPAADTGKLRGRCAIADLDAFIARARREADPASWEQIRWNAEWFQAKNTRVHGLNRE